MDRALEACGWSCHAPGFARSRWTLEPIPRALSLRSGIPPIPTYRTVPAFPPKGTPSWSCPCAYRDPPQGSSEAPCPCWAPEEGRLRPLRKGTGTSLALGGAAWLKPRTCVEYWRCACVCGRADYDEMSRRNVKLKSKILKSKVKI